MKVIKLIDNFVNSITMYRLILLGLSVLAVWAVVLGFFEIGSFAAGPLAWSAAVLLAICYGSNWVLARLFKAAPNVESALITALILFFVFAPAVNLITTGWLISAGVVSMASKYFLALGKKHLFNPAAITAVLFGLFTNYGAAWWFGSPALIIPIAVIGLLVVRKLKRFDLFWSCLLAGLITALFFTISGPGGPTTAKLINLASQYFLVWPTLFFVTIMVTEPLTTPPTKKWRIIYGLIIGLIYAAPLKLGPIYATPEVALIAGNIFSYLVSPKYKLFLKLVSKEKIGPDIYHFAFKPNTAFSFKAGQYLEWTLPHPKPDNRGNRRYFTIASAPSESTVGLGVKIQPGGSSFKQALLKMEAGQVMIGSQLAGDFVLPKNINAALVFIAGGIGITPFRSMLYQLIATKQKRDIILFYAGLNADAFVYRDILDQAGQQLGIKVVYVLTDATAVPADWSGETGRLTEATIKKYVPDIKTRMFYLSGPEAMVRNYKKLLRRLSVKSHNIVTDYFPGY